jgi:ABC-type uncharacterized transport system substrate-binding protein
MFPRHFWCAAALLALVGFPLWAHPHVWVDVKAELAVTSGYLDGVWTEWTFDDAFSQLILADSGPAGTGKLDARANAVVKRGYFDNLRAYGYFSHLALGTRTLEVPLPQKFQASVTPDQKVKYRFFLPLGVRLDAKTTFAVSFYDDSFFTDMVFVKQTPVVLAVTGGTASVVLKPDKSKSFYGGLVTPTFAFITWSPQ